MGAILLLPVYSMLGALLSDFIDFFPSSSSERGSLSNQRVYSHKIGQAAPQGEQDKHRRRIKTEAKAMVIVSVWGEVFSQFLAALAIYFAWDDFEESDG